MIFLNLFIYEKGRASLSKNLDFELAQNNFYSNSLRQYVLKYSESVTYSELWVQNERFKAL